MLGSHRPDNIPGNSVFSLKKRNQNVPKEKPDFSIYLRLHVLEDFLGAVFLDVFIFLYFILVTVLTVLIVDCHSLKKSQSVTLRCLWGSYSAFAAL